MMKRLKEVDEKITGFCRDKRKDCAKGLCRRLLYSKNTMYREEKSDKPVNGVANE
jgi:hypothetical protein